jgi:alpha-1,6-mannosyltransferase
MDAPADALPDSAARSADPGRTWMQTFTVRSERVRRVIMRPDRRRLAAGLGFLGTLIVATSAPLRERDAPPEWRPPNLWRLTLPFIPHSGSTFAATVLFVVGMTMLGVGWWLLGCAAADRTRPVGQRVRFVALVTLLWALPIMFGPPLLSKDVYSYAAQGELGSRGADPTAVGPRALAGGPFYLAADVIWRDNPAPYGPVWNKLAAKVVETTDHDPAKAVYGFRLLVGLGVAMAALAIVLIARSTGIDPAVALAIGIANPLTLVHILGGIHNDGLMLGFMLLGLAAARREHRFLGLALVVAASAVKLPAIIGVAYIGWNWGGPFITQSRRFFAASLASFVGLAALLGSTVVAGYSFGWVSALKGTSKVNSTFAPSTLLGRTVGDLGHMLGLPVDGNTFVSMFRLGGLLAAAFIAWWLLHRSHVIGVERAIGLSIVAVIVFGPVLWPWYLPPAIAVLAASGLERFRPAMWVAIFSASLFVFPASSNAHVGLPRFQATMSLGLLALLAVLAVVAQALCAMPSSGLRHWRQRVDEQALAPAPAPAQPGTVEAGAAEAGTAASVTA